MWYNVSVLLEYYYKTPTDNNKRRRWALVKCDDCNMIREVRRERRLLEDGNRHRCKSCHGKYRAKALHSGPSHNLGKQSPFKGKVRGPYKEPMSTSYIDAYGYRQVWCGKFPDSRGRKDGYRAEHHLVAEDELGRSLNAGEIVHHIDGDKLNNTKDNLYVCDSQKSHRHIHGQLEQTAMELVRLNIIQWEDGKYVINNRVIESRHG